MGISPPAASFPTVPAPLVPQAFSLFDDFIYSTGSASPLEFSGLGAGHFVNTSGVDKNHPGIIEYDLTATGNFSFTYISDTANQGVVLNEWETLSVEWQWFFTGFGADTGFGIGMGFNKSAAGCTNWPQQVGIGFTNNFGLCSNFSANNRLTAMCGKAGVLTFSDMRALAPLLGTWVKSRVLWTKSVPNVQFFTNDTLDATITTNIQDGFVASAKGMFGVGTFSSVAPGAGNFFRFDYVKVDGTLAR
jgi:hypothetical protein